jgi:hypothetical protein
MKTAIEIRYAAHPDDVKQWDTQRLRSGNNTTSDGEEIYFISNPPTGLWRAKE